MKTKTLYFLLLIVLLHIGVHNVAAQIIWTQTLPTTIGTPIILQAYVHNTVSGANANGVGDVMFTTSNENVAKITGSSLPIWGFYNYSTLTIVGAGQATITATDFSGAFASPVSKVINVPKQNQTITWTQPLSGTVGDQIQLTATASSGLIVAYTSNNSSVAAVSGNTLTIVGVGSATITASQAGNANYYAATNVAKIITVTQNSQNQNNYFQPDPSATYYIIHSSGLYFTTAVYPYPINSLYYITSYITGQDNSSDQQYKFVSVQGKMAVYNIMQVSSGEYLSASYIQEESDGYLSPFTFFLIL